MKKVDKEIELLSSERDHRKKHVAQSAPRDGLVEIGRGFRDSIDREINPADVSESEMSSAYIPRECQQYLDATEKEKWRKIKQQDAPAHNNPYADGNQTGPGRKSPVRDQTPSRLEQLTTRLESKQFLKAIKNPEVLLLITELLKM